MTSATELVIGSIIGAGVFTLSVVAGGGTSSLLVLAVIAVGLLAVLFGQLTRRIPYSERGMYVFAVFVVHGTCASPACSATPASS